jgi:hypothetical protein
MNVPDKYAAKVAAAVAALEAAGFYPVESDDDGEMWSMDLGVPGDSNVYLDVRLSITDES